MSNYLLHSKELTDKVTQAPLVNNNGLSQIARTHRHTKQLLVQSMHVHT